MCTSSLLDRAWLVVSACVFMAVCSMPCVAQTPIYRECFKLLPSDGAANDLFGISVAIHNDVILVGANQNLSGTPDPGKAYIFRRTWPSWVEEQIITSSDGSAHDLFGDDVAIWEDNAVIGAPSDDDLGDSSGSAYAFRLIGGTWVEVQKLLAPDGEALDLFGGKLAMEGTTLLIGARRGDNDENANAGAVYVFRDIGLLWVLEKKLFASDGATGDGFGGPGTDIEGDTAVIGAPGHDVDRVTGAGAAYVFQRILGGRWVETAKLIASDAAEVDHFGSATAISGNVIVVGAIGVDDNGAFSGAAYVFRDNGLTWVQEQKLTASDGAAFDYFGYGVSVQGDNILIGAYSDDDNGDRSGSVYHFVYDGSSWSEVQKVLPSDGSAGSLFGLFDVPMFHGFSVTGAHGEDVVGPKSGSAYVFLVDRDADGLADIWETNGIDSDNDSFVDLDLPSLGADPDHKDLFVEIDAMTGLAPDPAAISMVVDGFANAPVENLDGVDGITLHVEVDETTLPVAAWLDPWPAFDAVKAAHFGTPMQQGDPAALEAKAMAYRYCIFAKQHSGGGSSGMGEIPGDDFMVTLGHPSWPTYGGTVEQQAATFMHEMGHDLSFRHGGEDDINFKPNFKSIMNYTWQFRAPAAFPAYAGSWSLDYSNEALPTLDEGSLDEPPGIGGDPILSVPVGPITYGLDIEPMAGPIDWNRDGDVIDLGLFLCPGVPCDINRISPRVGPSPWEVLTGHDDWPNIHYGLCGHPNFTDGVHMGGTTEELSYDFYDAIFDSCPADFDNDGTVGASDLLALNVNWGPCKNFDTCIWDVDGDGTVGAADQLILLINWGPCP